MILPTETLAGAIVGHLIGDYLIQNDWMALNKKKSSFICAVHCMLWTYAVLIFSGWLFLPFWTSYLTGQVLYWLHYAQDRTDVIRKWMHLVGQDQFADGPCKPWSIIAVDNSWHIVVIFLINLVLKWSYQ